MTDSDDALLPLDAVRPAASSSAKDASPAKDTRGAVVPAPARPVARIAVDSPLPHLDRPFDYLVPASMHETAEPGVRVRVRFAGKLVDGFLLDRVDESDHEGRLTPLERVVSPERVLTPEVAALARAVADRYAGTLTDVLRLAVPPRHAKVEAEQPKEGADEPGEEPAGEPAGSAWDDYPAGPSFLDALRDGRAPRAVWSALPGARGWARPMAEAVRAALDGGRGAVLVVPDGKDVALADAEFARALGPGRHVALTADLGPAERYRRWLKVLRGQVRAVVGTRAAMFAPVAGLGLVAIWDDGDDLHAERLAPYPHAREVLGLRAHRTGAAMLIGGYARTAEATQLVAGGWARPIVAARATLRSLAPRVRPVGEDAELAKDQAARQARLPSLAWRALRHGLEGGGPVLVQVPRRGYLPALACHHCRTPARCVLPPTRAAAHLLDAPTAGTTEDRPTKDRPTKGGPTKGGPTKDGPVQGGPGKGGPAALTIPMPGAPGAPLPPAGDSAFGAFGAAGDAAPVGALCHGPLALRGGHAAPYCRWCGRVDAAWRCPNCGSPACGPSSPAPAAPPRLGRAFPSVPTCARPAATACWCRRARRPRPGRRHARRRAGRRGRLRGGRAAGRLGAARPGRPARRRGGRAPLDERRRPAPPRRRAGGAGRRRVARRPGPRPLGPRHARRARAGRPGRAGLPARRADGHAHRPGRRRPADAGRGPPAGRRAGPRPGAGGRRGPGAGHGPRPQDGWGGAGGGAQGGQRGARGA
ncbi:primosomal protein N' [Actinomadura sp. ATCC 31491]|uniref:Primosomal protein N n=1 Tax=Actinomadura luzonensis TaxID=2805427 RepID=A0ABT0G8A6_9ACTN|nr:primosomal protein N' [Actinomadura luzonensis]MCK2220807.1 primosomal protein N' [Actinomadura luzonensis]